MLFRNWGVVAIALFTIGCATTSTETVECEPVCEMQEVCEDTEECEAILYEVGTKEVCETQTVEIEQEICNAYEDIITTCSETPVSYTDTVTGSTTVSYTDTDCSTSTVSHTDSVCATGSHTYTQTDCDDDLVTLSGEVCETTTVTHHRVLDFDTAADGTVIPAGTWGNDIALAYQDWGVTLSVANYNGSASSTALSTFDSLSPTGGDDDLGTENSSWGGPGVGSGGYDTNFFERGNLLIHAEDLDDFDGDGLLDDPDDEAGGAEFWVQFTGTVCVQSLTIVDIESSENGYLRLFDSSGTEILTQQVIGLGNNSVQILDPEVCGVAEMVFEMCGSGAIDDVRFSYDEQVETCLDYDEECLQADCTDSQVTEDVNVCTDHAYTCTETDCIDTVVTENVTTETEHTYACTETICTEQAVKVQICETHVVSEKQEVCVDVPDLMAGLSCTPTETCTRELVCDDSECDPGNEWLSGGGFPGSK